MADPMVLAGHGRMLTPPGDAAPARVALDEAGFTLDLGGTTRAAAYRDLETIAVQEGATLLVLGTDAGAERVLLDRFGSGQGQLVRELRDRRLRQRAGDALITLAADEPIVMVEFDDGTDHGVGQLAYHGLGALLVPLDERRPPLRIRRSGIAAVRINEIGGSVEIDLGARPGVPIATIRLIGLGAAARVHTDRFAGLRTGAASDAARIVGGLIPDASYGARQEAAGLLVDGNPARPADLPTSWSSIEAGVLVDPTFAASYVRLRELAGSLADERAIAIAPLEPGGDEACSWFLIPLPGNLLALELVSGGAHATYCFRLRRRAEFGAAASDPTVVGDAVRAVSEALVDSRFLREPLALTDEALAQPQYLRYRLALAVLPSLAAARARFVARIVHRDDVAWAAALDDLIAWHGTARDDGAVWPGRAAQDAMVEAVGGTAPESMPADPPDQAPVQAGGNP